MSTLISASKLSHAFATRTLFREITFAVREGQKIGLIGPNGAGKSTLLKILARQLKPDAGELHFAGHLRLAYLAQSPQFAADETVLSSILRATSDPHDNDNLALTHELIAKFDLDGPEAGESRLVRELSGGWKKRVALARELVKRPNLLLLDEPTNHLDLPSILWLEETLQRHENLAVVTVTHDRLFLQNTCDWIFDLDRRNPDGLIKFEGTYADFLDLKESQLQAQQSLEDKRRNLLRRETAWLRRGSLARQTKQRARIERAHELKDEVASLRDKNTSRRLEVDFGEVGKSPKKLIEAKNISKRLGDRILFENFSIQVGPHSRIGLLGRNGCGKSTLIRQLIGQEKPDTGEVLLAEGVGIAYFEQQKDTLDPAISLLKTICPAGDYVDVQGHSVFAKSYLARFHFRPEQMDMPVGKLSGGEQSRLRIAQLMMKRENLLILDEPTNDLDIATLDVLQEALMSFPGAVILVTHDRYFLDQVANQILAFTDDGKIISFADFFQWDEWQKANRPRPAFRPGAGPSAASHPAPVATAPLRKGKLSFNEQREFDQMESVIEGAELKLRDLQNQVAEFSSDYEKLQEATRELQKQQELVDQLYARWSELSDKRSGRPSIS